MANTLCQDPLDSQVLYVASQFGLYYSLDGGQHWLKEHRIPNVAIFEMRFCYTDRSLFLFTHGRGIWYAKLKSTIPTSAEQLQAQKPSFAFKVFPNPFLARGCLRASCA